MFASRCGRQSPEGICVLAGSIAGDAGFDLLQKYRVFRVPLAWSGPKGFEWLGVVWQLFRAGLRTVGNCKVSVIECARPIPEGVAGACLAIVLRKKLIVNFHGEDISVMRRYRVEKRVLRWVIRRADLNLANSRFTENQVRDLGGPGIRTAVVFPGFNPAQLGLPDPVAVEALRRRFGTGPILATVGRIQSRKGQDNVIRALPLLIGRFPGLRYLVVGSSQGGTQGLGDRLQTLAREAGVESHVIVVGETSAAELIQYFSLCDVFIMANREECGDVEGFGIVFLEAGWMGKPVIGGRSGGVPDAVREGETGLLVDGTSVEDIAAAVANLLEDPAKARAMGSKGRSHAEGMTDAHVFARYQEALDSAGF